MPVEDKEIIMPTEVIAPADNKARWHEAIERKGRLKELLTEMYPLAERFTELVGEVIDNEDWKVLGQTRADYFRDVVSVAPHTKHLDVTILALKEKHLTDREIADATGRNQSTISRRVHKLTSDANASLEEPEKEYPVYLPTPEPTPEPARATTRRPGTRQAQASVNLPPAVWDEVKTRMKTTFGSAAEGIGIVLEAWNERETELVESGDRFAVDPDDLHARATPVVTSCGTDDSSNWAMNDVEATLASLLAVDLGHDGRRRLRAILHSALNRLNSVES